MSISEHIKLRIAPTRPANSVVAGRPAPRPSGGRAQTVIIGAGPYGLSVAAHLRALGMPVRVFGDVMSSWRLHMPTGMCLKSTPAASSLSAAVPGYTLADYCDAHGIRPLTGTQIVPADLFIAYGEWFQRRLVPDVEPLLVERLARADGQGFALHLSDGSELAANGVVVASGVTGFAYTPPELAAAAGPDGPSAAGLVSHSSQHRDLSVFAGREVAVVGAGQSALETAALLHESGARVQVLVRGAVRWGLPPAPPKTGLLGMLPQPNSPLGPTWRIYPFSHAPQMFRYLPADTRLRLVRQVLGPLGAWWLRDRVDGSLPVLEGQRVTSARGDAGKVVLNVDSPEGPKQLRVDHVLAATGYRVDLARMDFLDSTLRDELRKVSGWPHLTGSFESSVPGLFFAGQAAAETFGPVMRFACGAGFAARRISARAAAGLPTRPR
ncbi:MAG TPA: NAD(P)-binding domain-containing protein [Actinospica sp.]|nr:NAD(P)-binding domain-containing protein [Actinospica sp.]